VLVVSGSVVAVVVASVVASVDPDALVDSAAGLGPAHPVIASSSGTRREPGDMHRA
jgi:hypothetical protein